MKSQRLTIGIKRLCRGECATTGSDRFGVTLKDTTKRSAVIILGLLRRLPQQLLDVSKVFALTMSVFV